MAETTSGMVFPITPCGDVNLGTDYADYAVALYNHISVNREIRVIHA